MVNVHPSFKGLIRSPRCAERPFNQTFADSNDFIALAAGGTGFGTQGLIVTDQYFALLAVQGGGLILDLLDNGVPTSSTSNSLTSMWLEDSKHLVMPAVPGSRSVNVNSQYNGAEANGVSRGFIHRTASMELVSIDWSSWTAEIEVHREQLNTQTGEYSYGPTTETFSANIRGLAWMGPLRYIAKSVQFLGASSDFENDGSNLIVTEARFIDAAGAFSSEIRALIDEQPSDTADQAYAEFDRIAAMVEGVKPTGRAHIYTCGSSTPQCLYWQGSLEVTPRASRGEALVRKAISSCEISVPGAVTVMMQLDHSDTSHETQEFNNYPLATDPSVGLPALTSLAGWQSGRIGTIATIDDRAGYTSFANPEWDGTVPDAPQDEYDAGTWRPENQVGTLVLPPKELNQMSAPELWLGGYFDARSVTADHVERLDYFKLQQLAAHVATNMAPYAPTG